jgi:membrane protein required for colicin V production
MGIDIIVLILAIMAFVRGWKKGLLWAVCSLIAVMLGILIAMKLSSELSQYLFAHHILSGQYTMLISFVLLFSATMFLARMLVKFAEKILDTLFLGWVNNLIGGLLYSFFAIFIVSTFCWLASQVHLLNADLISSSKTYNYLKPIAPKTLSLITDYLPYCKNVLAQVQTHLSQVMEIRE